MHWTGSSQQGGTAVAKSFSCHLSHNLNGPGPCGCGFRRFRRSCVNVKYPSRCFAIVDLCLPISFVRAKTWQDAPFLYSQLLLRPVSFYTERLLSGVPYSVEPPLLPPEGELLAIIRSCIPPAPTFQIAPRPFNLAPPAPPSGVPSILPKTVLSPCRQTLASETAPMSI
jgi:hypothetical protein